MGKLVNRLPVEVNTGILVGGDIPIFNETTRLWETVNSSSFIADNIQLDLISGSRFAERKYFFPQELEVEGDLTASNLLVYFTASTSVLGIGTTTPEVPLDVKNIDGRGIYSIIGDDVLSGVTIWDGTYQSNHPLKVKIPSLDSTLVTLVNKKPYGGTFDDDYYQFVNYIDLDLYTDNDDENIYGMYNYIVHNSPYSQSGTIYTFTNSEENINGYLNNVFTNYNISRTAGISARTQTVTAVLGWIQAAESGSVGTSYGFRSLLNATNSGSVDKHYQFYADTNIQSDGNISNLFGVYTKLSGIQSTAFVTRYAGITSLQGLISASNNTLLLLGTETIPNGNYSMYSDTNYPSYILGNVGIGDLPSVDTKLHIYGRQIVDGQFVVRDTSTFQQVREKSKISSGSTPSTINFELLDGAVVYYVDEVTQNWAVNFRGNSSTTLNDIMDIGQSMTCVLVMLNGTTPYSASLHQIDGSTITPNWQGGSSPSGEANCYDAYSYSILKTANATFTLLASKVNFS
jgi:hypothetical protein